jgi:hypothetical protein
MRAAFGIDALFGDSQPFHRAAAHQVLSNNFFGVFRPYIAVPHGIRINHHRGPMLALVQAAGFVDPHLRTKSSFSRQLLQPCVQFAFSILRAAGPRRIGGADIMADKNVTFERRQAAILLCRDNPRVKPPSASAKFFRNSPDDFGAWAAMLDPGQPEKSFPEFHPPPSARIGD